MIRDEARARMTRVRIGWRGLLRCIHRLEVRRDVEAAVKRHAKGKIEGGGGYVAMRVEAELL